MKNFPFEKINEWSWDRWVDLAFCNLIRIRAISKSNESMHKRRTSLIVPLPNNEEESNVVDEGKHTVAGCSNIGVRVIESLCIRGKIIPVLLLYILLNDITTFPCPFLVVSLLEPSSSSWTLSPIIVVVLVLLSNRVLTLT